MSKIKVGYPQPSTLNLQPSTLNPQPSTLNPQSSTLNPQPSALNPQPSTLNLFVSSFAFILTPGCQEYPFLEGGEAGVSLTALRNKVRVSAFGS